MSVPWSLMERVPRLFSWTCGKIRYVWPIAVGVFFWGLPFDRLLGQSDLDPHSGCSRGGGHIYLIKSTYFWRTRVCGGTGRPQMSPKEQTNCSGLPWVLLKTTRSTFVLGKVQASVATSFQWHKTTLCEAGLLNTVYQHGFGQDLGLPAHTQGHLLVENPHVLTKEHWGHS